MENTLFFSNIMLFMITIIMLFGCSSSEDKTKSRQTVIEYVQVEGRFEQTDSDKGIFFLKAKRLKSRPDEYLPSSESFRVEVMTSNLKKIWQSNYNKNYFQVISEVKPKNEGETTEFQFDWNLKNNEGKKMPAGDYKARLLIPSSPEIYFTTIDFAIK
jgi:flagellar hook assembly protein FlgD